MAADHDIFFFRENERQGVVNVVILADIADRVVVSDDFGNVWCLAGAEINNGIIGLKINSRILQDDPGSQAKILLIPEKVTELFLNVGGSPKKRLSFS